MTRLALLALALALPNASSFDTVGAVDDARRAVEIDVGAPDSHCGSVDCAALLVRWSYSESGHGKATLGDCVDPAKRTISTCRSFGAMQTVTPWKWVKGATAERVVSDRVLSYRVGLTIVKYALDQCKGDVRRAMGLYSSGMSCGAASALVAARCAGGWC